MSCLILICICITFQNIIFINSEFSIAKEKENVILLQNEKATLHNHIIMKDKQIQRGMREREDKILRYFNIINISVIF